MLDSLARYYNSQITAHVGYMISVAAILAAFFLTLLSSFVWKLELRQQYLIGAIICIVFLTMGFVSFRYLFGRTQYWAVLSQITWEHMGLKHPYLPGAYIQAIQKRALAIGAEEAIMTLFRARLFVSRYMDQKEKLQKKGITDSNIRDRLGAFKILEERGNGAKTKERDVILPLGPYYSTAPKPRIFRMLNIKYVTILWLAYRQHPLDKTEDELLRLDAEALKGSSLSKTK